MISYSVALCMLCQAWEKKNRWRLGGNYGQDDIIRLLQMKQISVWMSQPYV